MIVGIKELRAKLTGRARLLALDHAKTRIGVALGDLTTGLATPLTVLNGKNFTENVGLLAMLCQEYGIKAFIIGLPLDMDGSEGPRAQSVRHFALNLEKAKEQLGFKPVIAFVDERLTSFDADERIAELDRRGQTKAREMQDALAALAIMEDALRQLGD